MSLNQSEEKLGALAKKTFLSMWSYENPFYEQGKELCDVLVVFGNDVIIISDKFNQYGDHPKAEVNWKRWYRKAVSASIRQLAGAKSHLQHSPDKVFVDAKVSSPLPLKLPEKRLMRVHLIAVANGCEDACEEAVGRRSLMVDTRCVDDSLPFTVGTASADGAFVHVISMPALDALFDSFDTTRDFIDYLDRKQAALCAESWQIHGEENLIAAYMTSQRGDQPFFIPTERFDRDDGICAKRIDPGLWESYLDSDHRAARLRLWAKSYLVDRIVESFTADYANGGMIVGQDQPITYHEAAFRYLAGESRLSRQAIAGSFYEIHSKSERSFWCTFCRSEDDHEIYYLWLLYPQPREEWPLDDVEHILRRELEKYLLVAQSKLRHARLIFGMCAPLASCSLTSFICMAVNDTIWTSEMAARAEYLVKEEGILSSVEDFTIGSFR